MGGAEIISGCAENILVGANRCTFWQVGKLFWQVWSLPDNPIQSERANSWRMECEEIILPDWSPPEDPARPCRPMAGYGLVMMMMRVLVLVVMIAMWGGNRCCFQDWALRVPKLPANPAYSSSLSSLAMVMVTFTEVYYASKIWKIPQGVGILVTPQHRQFEKAYPGLTICHHWDICWDASFDCSGKVPLSNSQPRCRVSQRC